MQTELKVGDNIKCIISKALSTSGYGPPVKLEELYEVKEIIRTRGDHDHIDVGLKSTVGSVSCLETGDIIPRGSEIAWCHPSRFEKI